MHRVTRLQAGERGIRGKCRGIAHNKGQAVGVSGLQAWRHVVDNA